ncbi:molybdenum cofactor guanylyltransferase [Psychrobacter sp. AOP22-C1-C5]|uniref:molybdenum cofactor guanylyltransferase n=1 Tax=Psychrobacter sp. AOP22-C1-C5 TaxID=3457716 RepID=UPI00403651FE
MIEDSIPSDILAGVVILAGGASRRMGTPKAKLTLPTGETLLDYHVRHSLDLNVPIMIADNERGFHIHSDLMLNKPRPLVSYIADYEPNNDDANKNDEKSDNGGALVAIESALQTLLKMDGSGASQQNKSSWLFVISCDSLIPAMDLWQKLQSSIAQAVDKKVICLTDDSHLYPLLGIYKLSIEPDLKKYIDRGQRRVMSFIEPVVQSVPFANDWQYLTNFNTPQDFARACMALSDL